jgi:hypothetical protein
MSIGAHKKVDLVLKNKSLKKSKVVIGIWYASGGKKFNLQIRKKKRLLSEPLSLLKLITFLFR